MSDEAASHDPETAASVEGASRTRKPHNYVIVVRDDYGSISEVAVKASKKEAEDFIAGVDGANRVDLVIKGEIVTPKKIFKL